MIFPSCAGCAAPPSQLYEAGLEGIGLFCLLAWLFWRTDARYQPGRLTGAFLLGYGLIRIFLENFREPDEQLGFIFNLITMGQILSLPMIIGGIFSLPRRSDGNARPTRRSEDRTSPDLAEQLAQKIAADGPLTVHDFMAAANAHYSPPATRSAAMAISSRHPRSARCSAN